jgi:hypothetical protein
MVTIAIDGHEVDRFVAAATTMSRTFEIPPSNGSHQVGITVSNVVNPRMQHFGEDTRDLGMQLRTIWWQQ